MSVYLIPSSNPSAVAGVSRFTCPPKKWSNSRGNFGRTFKQKQDGRATGAWTGDLLLSPKMLLCLYDVQIIMNERKIHEMLCIFLFKYDMGGKRRWPGFGKWIHAVTFLATIWMSSLCFWPYVQPFAVCLSELGSLKNLPKDHKCSVCMPSYTFAQSYSDASYQEAFSQNVMNTRRIFYTVFLHATETADMHALLSPLRRTSTRCQWAESFGLHLNLGFCRPAAQVSARTKGKKTKVLHLHVREPSFCARNRRTTMQRWCLTAVSVWWPCIRSACRCIPIEKHGLEQTVTSAKQFYTLTFSRRSVGASACKGHGRSTASLQRPRTYTVSTPTAPCRLQPPFPMAPKI